MADRRKSHRSNQSYNLINRIELDALRSLTPINSSNSLQLKSEITKRIQEGYYDQIEILDHIAQQIVSLYCRK